MALPRPVQVRNRETGGLTVGPDDIVAVQQSLVNAYFIGRTGARDREWILVDAGLPMSADTFREAAARRFGRRCLPAAIVLTHGHFDHVGALPELIDDWQVPVYCHPLELPYLTGRSSYPPPDPTVGGLMGFLSRFFPRGPIDLSGHIEPLPEDGRVPGADGWRWIETPGHSPGHVSFFRDADRTLIAGDAFVTVAQESAWSVLLQDGFVRRPPPYYTTDWPSARTSIETLLELNPQTAFTGHGPPVSGPDLQHGLRALLEDWDAAVPHGCRYADRPALCDVRGTVWVPPPVRDRRLEAVLFGTAMFLGWRLMRSASTTHTSRRVT